MITSLYLMYSKDTGFQNAHYSAGIHVLQKLKAMQSHPKSINTQLWYSITVLQVNYSNFLQNEKKN